jgi:hypothetical protein
MCSSLLLLTTKTCSQPQFPDLRSSNRQKLNNHGQKSIFLDRQMAMDLTISKKQEMAVAIGFLTI